MSKLSIFCSHLLLRSFSLFLGCPALRAIPVLCAITVLRAIPDLPPQGGESSRNGQPLLLLFLFQIAEEQYQKLNGHERDNRRQRVEDSREKERQNENAYQKRHPDDK
jgi:hypothetical protein